MVSQENQRLQRATRTTILRIILTTPLTRASMTDAARHPVDRTAPPARRACGRSRRASAATPWCRRCARRPGDARAGRGQGDAPADVAARNRSGASPARLAADAAPSLRRRHQRDRRDHPHEPRTRAARATRPPHASRRSRAATPTSNTTSTQGARGQRDVHAERLLCRLTGAEAAVVVNNNAAATLLVLAALAAGREVIDLARRAGRDRRRLPRAGRHGAVGRGPARGRHDQPDAGRRLRGGDRRSHGADPARPSVELPHRGVHRAAGARGAGRARAPVQGAGRRGPRQRLSPASATRGATRAARRAGRAAQRRAPAPTS